MFWNYEVVISIHDNLGGISSFGGLPWGLKNATEEMFQLVTSAPPQKKNVLIMEYGTWLMLPENFRTHPNLGHCVIFPADVLKNSLPKGVWVTKTLWGALMLFDFFEEAGDETNQYASIFVIGGKDLYTEALSAKGNCSRLHLHWTLNSPEETDCIDYMDWWLLPPAEFELEKESPLKSEDGIKYKSYVYRYQPRVFEES